MTDNDIIKALEEWIKALKDDYKRLQALDAPMDCFEESHIDNIRILSNALDLINRKNVEIDFVKSSRKLAEASVNTLKAELDLAKAFHKEAVAERNLLNIQLGKAKTENEALYKINAQSTEEISELRKELCKRQNLEENFSKSLKQADKKLEKTVKLERAKAVKEFAERLKEKFACLEYVIQTNRKTLPIERVKAEVDAVLQNGCSNVVDKILKETVGEVDGTIF